MKKIWLIVAILLILVGAVTFLGALAMSGFDFLVLDSQGSVINTYEFEDVINKIVIDVDTTDIRFVPAEDGCFSVVCQERDKLRHGVYVKDNALMIELLDTRSWYDHIGIFFGEMEITVYLPVESGYGLTLETDTGDVEIPESLLFSYIDIEGDTSDISCAATVMGRLKVDVDTGDVEISSPSVGLMSLSTNTGDIVVERVKSPGAIKIETDTGRVNLNEVECVEIDIEGDTGDIILNDVLASRRILIDNGTGDVELKLCDAELISIETSTGDVSGILLSDKTFLTKTSTGRVKVPNSLAENHCQVTTSTGDITFTVANGHLAIPNG